MNRVVMRLLIFCACIAPLLATADFSRGVAYSPGFAPDRFEQREHYLAAMNLIQTHQFTAYEKLKPGLRTYALYPYLEYSEKIYRISRQSEADILDFIQQNEQTPLVEPLVHHWLLNLAKRGEWELLLKYYDRVNPSDELACHQGTALVKTGRNSEAMQRAEELWLVGESQPDDCDPLFSFWRSNDGLTRDNAWRRFALSLEEHESRLSKYLLRFIDREDRSYAGNYRLVHFEPRTIQRYQSFRQNNIRNREIILHGVKRLARADPEEAAEALRHYESTHNFDPEALEAAWASIGVRLAIKSPNIELSDSLPVNLHNHPDLVEARIRQNLKQGEWRNVLVLINLLPRELQDSDRWQYWKARVLAQSQGEADRKTASEIFTALSTDRSFYGFVSADIMGLDYNFQDEPVAVTLDQILSLEQAPGIQRALELFALGERSRARREWYFTTANFTTAEREVAARVALRWGWYKASIQTMIDASRWNRLDYRFPVAYRDNFLAHAQRANIPVPWSLAIARQESAFMPDARSSAGALGVMQLMPGTAQHVARQMGVSYANNTSLWEPDLNIQLGTHYLGEMLRRYSNNRILASAAYNAGPGNVDRWLDPSLPFDVWIEVIPFNETRNYVQNVLMFSSIYSRRLDENQPLLYPHERSYFSNQHVIAIPGPAIETPEKS